jgi:hypothetical protein
MLSISTIQENRQKLRTQDHFRRFFLLHAWYASAWMKKGGTLFLPYQPDYVIVGSLLSNQEVKMEICFMAESELARMRREIEETYAAMQQGLSGFAVTARHEIIRHKHQQLAAQQERLEQLVGTEATRTVMVEAQDQVIKGTQPTPGPGAENGAAEAQKGGPDERTIVYALIEMHLPDFQQGYASGRKERAQGGEGLTDEDLLAMLRVLEEEGAFLPENEELLQWHIGRCVGQMDVRPREEMMHIALDILRRASQVLSTAETKLEELRRITMELLRVESQREQRGQ